MTKSWKTDLATGIQLIDAQHRELFARIDRLLDKMLAGEDPKAYGETFRFVRAYADFHFGTEEGLMDSNAYPQTDFHKSQHRWFVAEIDKIHAENMARGLDGSSQMRLSYVLVDWFSNHIRGVDHKLTAFLKERRVAVPPPDRTPG